MLEKIQKKIKVNIGITWVEDLVSKNPEDLYLTIVRSKGRLEDRCQLYVFRMAAYYAEYTETRY